MGQQNFDVKKSYSSLSNPQQDGSFIDDGTFAISNRQEKFALYCINVRAKSRRMCPELSIRKLSQNDNLL